MRALVLALALLGTCGGPSEPDLEERAARDALARRGLEAIELRRVDPQTFDFTARRGEARCEGTLVVHPRTGGTSTAAMQYRCE